MRILIDNGCYDLLNQGDVAMLQVAVGRLNSLWPNSIIQVITEAPDRLATYCPTAVPIHPQTCLSWHKVGRLFGRRYQFAPEWVSRRLLKLERAIWLRWPLLAQFLAQLKIRRRRLKVDPEEVNLFAQAFFRADLIVASGGGYITDQFSWLALKLLKTLELATELGTPTVMFSQGLGPVQQPALQAQVKNVLPRVNLLALRENRVGTSLLSSLGALPTQVVVTGDDAIEPAHAQRPAQLGTGIGLNLRVTAYSGVNNGLVEIVRKALDAIVCKYGARLIPLPISFYHGESDVTTLQQLLEGYDDDSNGGQNLDNPFKVIEQLKGCRLVVTGSYHPAVFALAQGIPVIGLVKSAYYFDKFMGLADQFGVGCEVISLDDENFCDKLIRGVDNMWQSAEQVRPQLLDAAARQIEAGQAAYQRLYELVQTKY